MHGPFWVKPVNKTLSFQFPSHHPSTTLGSGVFYLLVGRRHVQRSVTLF